MYDCPICIQTRAAVTQAATGVVYPFLLAPMAAFMYATRHFTYKLPSITTQTGDVARLWWKFVKSGSTMASVILGLNMFAAMYLTHKEMQQHYNINMKMAEFERKVDSGSYSSEELKQLKD